MDSTSYYSYRTLYGLLTIRSNENGITDVVLGQRAFDGAHKPSALTNATATQIMEYLAGKRHVFDVPLAPQGSAFQLAVWREVTRVPYGSSVTCAQLAGQLGNAENFRAVGSAVRKNPISILVPAHRVVGADGHPLGSGKSADLKAALLRMEVENAQS